MKKSLLFTIILQFVSFVTFAQNQAIKLNQVGYYPTSVKKAAVVNTTATTFEIQTTNGTVVHTGTLGAAEFWNGSNENVKVIDFTNFQTIGTYNINIPGLGKSYTFEISPTALAEPARKSIRYFYYNRASSAIIEPYAEGFARAGGHWDNSVQVCEDKNYTGGTANGANWSSPGGWYDAGDYNKYMQTAGISLYTLLSIYEQYPSYITNLNLNIPESGNSIPDLLDECMYEINWMLTSQDIDGGVFAKVTDQYFSNFVMPNVATGAAGPRYICRKNTPSTYQFAASLAAAYRILEPVENLLPVGYRNTLLAASKKAWTWAIAHPSVAADNCACSITTGGYGDSNSGDEWTWAACEMYLATGDITYYNTRRTNITGAALNNPNWGGGKEALGFISLLLNQNKLAGNALTDVTTVKNKFLSMADYFNGLYNSTPYRIMKCDSYDWGSNGDAGNQSFITLSAYEISGQAKYLESGLSNMDYLLGKNPLSYSFITGIGDKQVSNSHHRISASDGIAAEVPGMVFGGPYKSATGFKLSGWTGEDEYANAEVTINWNAPVAFSLAAIAAIFTQIPPTSISVSPKPLAVPLANNITVTATVLPLGSNPTVTWKSSNTAIATVNAAGVVTGVATGNAYIIASTGTFKDSTLATVSPISITSVAVSPTTVSIAVAETSQLIATTTPANPSVKTITWTSSNTAIATVSQTGLITGVSTGSATITATTTDGSFTATSTITVTPNPNIVAASQTPTAVTVDGNLSETLWNLDKSIAKSVSGVKNNTETFGVLWDNTNLYVGIKVLTQQLPQQMQMPTTTDAVELYFDMNNNGSVFDAADRQWIKVYNSTSIWEKIGTVSGAVTTTSKVVSSSKPITGGYTVELAIPWTSLGVTPSTAGYYSFDVVVNDCDGGTTRSNQTVWVGDANNWQDLSNIGDLQLLPPSITTVNQTIALQKGWNLISTNVHPSDSTIATLFAGLDVQMVKNADGFWEKGQVAEFNSLQTITAGKGYLINMNTAGTFTVTGKPLTINNSQLTINNGWNLIGCPYQTATLFSTQLNITNCEIIKNFDGFWEPNGTTNSITNFESGKAYFIKKIKPTSLYYTTELASSTKLYFLEINE